MVHAQVVCVCLCAHTHVHGRRSQEDSRGKAAELGRLTTSLTFPSCLHLQGPAGMPGPEGRQGEKGAKVRERPSWMLEHSLHLWAPLIPQIPLSRCLPHVEPLVSRGVPYTYFCSCSRGSWDLVPPLCLILSTLDPLPPPLPLSSAL